MIDPYLIGLIGILLVIILLLLFERASILDQAASEKSRLLDELSKAIKAVISKNANDYVMTTSIDRVASQEQKEEEPEEVPIDTLSDDEFDKALGIKREAPKK